MKGKAGVEREGESERERAFLPQVNISKLQQQPLNGATVNTCICRKQA